MSKFSVKRPFTVLVAVVMLIVLGVVSFMKLTTDLLPTLSIPYVMVMTTYPGASPERVESDVTQVLEEALGTVNGVENVTSSSSENYSLVTLEFADETNMDSAMVKLSTQVNQLEFPDKVGTPILMELSPDMMATMYVAVNYEGRDIYDLTAFVEEEVVPHFERQEGVASVTPTGMVEKTVEIRLDKKKVDALNAKVLGIATDKLDEAQAELDDAKKELNDASAEINKGQEELKEQQATTTEELAKYSMMLDEAVATKAAYGAILVGLQTDEIALKAELKAYKDNKVPQSYKKINEGFAQARAALQSEETYNSIYNAIYEQVRIAAVQQALASAGMTGVVVDATNLEQYLAMLGPEVTAQINEAAAQQAATLTQQQIDQQLANIPVDVKDALDHPEKLKAFKAMMKEQGQEEAASALTKKNLQQLYDIVEVRIPQIETELANLKIEIAATEQIVKEVGAAIAEAEAAYVDVEAGKITAAASFGAYTAQMESGKATIEQGKEQMKQAQEQLDESRDKALESANMDALLTIETLSQLIAAQNFSMPAGYIQNDDDTEMLVRIGDEFDSVEEIENMILCKVDKIGDVRISDVAEVSVVDNADESYAKLNSDDGVILSIMKSSTAGTSDVSKTCNEAIEELQKEYPGLHIIPLMDQGDYIGLIINSVLSNLIWGALLAIIVLAIFLKDYKPTIVVAFSIPMSVLFAIVLMYFTDITMNMISLSGLALGVGMLVDNSIVVIENIYRLRNKGVPAARAAVMGAKQVGGAIAASTLTTICVFLPIVFTTGLTRQIFTDMALTIAYSLIASLIVALTFVPCMSATVLKNSEEKKHPWFDKMTAFYEKTIRASLKFKIVPIAVSLALLIFCVIRVVNMGMVLLPSMGGNQMSISMSVPTEWEVEEGYAAADDLMEKIKEIDGVVDVGIMSGGGGGDLMMSSGSNKDFSIFILLDDATGKDNGIVAEKLEAIMQEGFSETEYTIATSNMDISALMSSGLQIQVYGEDLDAILEVSKDMVKLIEEVKGFENVTNGQEEADKQLVVSIDKDKAMRHGLSVAQIFMELSGKLTTDADVTTLTTDEDDYQVVLVNETKKITKDNLMDYEFTTKTTDDEGKEVEEKHKLKEFATVTEGDSVASISRVNLERYITVSAETMDGYNTTLLSRQVEDKLEKYEAPEGVRVELAGESTEVMSMLEDMILMIVLAIIFIYLIMVAQFQSLLSPFIVLFTIPLAFTGGLIGLMMAGEDISMIAMMGFLILAGVVVNNGIVFVDYTNQLRLAGMEKREALVETGKARMRPILMTALTTILAMMTMAFSKDASAVMSRGMVIVTIGGLAYATLMTLYIVPVMYDIFFRREIKEVDIGDENDFSDLDGPV